MSAITIRAKIGYTNRRQSQDSPQGVNSPRKTAIPSQGGHIPRVIANGIGIYYEEHGSGEPQLLISGTFNDHTAACDVVPGDTIVPFTRHIQDKQPYPTLTRRMQFYIDHDWFLELGEALPAHKPNPTMGGNYPLQLTGGHARWSIHSLWKDSPILLRLQRGEPIIFMSAANARSRGISDGDRVEVFNDVGSTELQAVVSAAVRPGQVIIYHDWENFMFKGKRHFKSLMPSPLNPIEMVGGYGHIRPRLFPFYSATPGGNDRGTRVERRGRPRTLSRGCGGMPLVGA